MRNLLWLCGLFWLAGSSLADPVGHVIPMREFPHIPPYDTATAFNLGKSAGSETLNSVKNLISQGNIDGMKSGSKPITVNSNPPETAFFGLPGLQTKSADKMTGCAASNPHYTNSLSAQECDAVNFLVKNPVQRMKVAIDKNDPVLQNARSILKDPMRFAGATDSAVYSNCTESTVTGPPTNTIQTCTSTPQIADETCSTSKQFATNCAGAVTATPSHTTQQGTYQASLTNIATAATQQSSTSCTNLCSVTSCSTTWSVSPYAICSGGTTRQNQIINVYTSVLGRCADSAGLNYFDGSGMDMTAVRSALMASSEYTTWAAQGFPITRSLPGFCGSDLFQSLNLCQGYSCSSSTTSATNCSTSSAGLICSGNSVENTIIGYYQTYLGRCADAAGLNYYVNAYNTGTSWATIQSLISGSSEAVNYASQGKPYERPYPSICGSAGLLSGTNTCKTCSCSTGSQYQSCSTTYSYTCPNGSTLSGSSCLTPTLTCPNGGTLSVPTGFICSGTSTQNTIIGYYQTYLGRCADALGLTYYVNLYNAGTSFAAIQGMISGSTEAADYALNGAPYSAICTATQDVYSCPDTMALNGGRQGGSSSSIYYGTIQPLTCASADADEAAVIASFKNCLGRCPDVPGLTWFATGIKTGTYTASSANTTICASPEATDWANKGKPTLRSILSLCGADKKFENYDKCRKVDVTYTSFGAIPSAQCTGNVDYADTGSGCEPGTTATRITGYTQISNCKYNSGQCVVNSSTCTPGSTVVNGIPVSDSCMTGTVSQTCRTGAITSDCDGLINSGCSQQSSQCAYSDTSGCLTTVYEYKCKKSDGLTSTTQNCGDQKLQLGQFTFDTGFDPDTDFAKIVTAMEAAREAGTYMDPASLRIFSGFDSRCAEGYAGLKKCCKVDVQGGAGMSNSGVFGSLISQGVSNAGSYVAAKASPYVYDAMWASDQSWLMDRAFNAWSANTLAGAESMNVFTFNPSLSLYGITWTSASTLPSAMLGTNIEIGTAGDFFGGTLYFNPYLLGAQLAVMVITDLMSCTQDEQMLGLKRGQNLCHFVGPYCSNKVPILGCLETTQTYCCFNSRLGKLIQEQGRAQIGKSWGSGESPNCSGYTADELAQLDFSQMDMSEFVAEVMANAHMPDAAAMGGTATTRAIEKIQNFYGGQK